MTSASRELFRLALLRVMDANTTAHGLGAHALATLVIQYGFRVTVEETQHELRYLEDKGYVSVPPKNISPENKTWRITAAGRDELATQG